MSGFRPILGRGVREVYNATQSQLCQLPMYVPSVPANLVWTGNLDVCNSQHEQKLSEELHKRSVATSSTSMAIDKEGIMNLDLKKGKKERKNFRKDLQKVKESMDQPSAIYCVLCKSNGETEKVYRSHSLRNCKGNVSCPILRAYNCPLCNNGGGDDAHTLLFCPENVGEKHVECVISKIKLTRNAMGVVKNN